MTNLQRQYINDEQTCGQDVLNLVLTKCNLAKLLENKAVARLLKLRQAAVLAEFESSAPLASLVEPGIEPASALRRK